MHALTMTAGAVLAAAVGCSASSSPAAPDAAPPILYGLCPEMPTPVAVLSSYDAANYGYTTPMRAGETRDVTFTIINTGAAPATQMLDGTPSSSALRYNGGAYPGTKGTCGASLAPAATCTLDMTLTAPAAGASTDLLVVEYYNDAVYTTDTRVVRTVVTNGSFAPADHPPLPRMPRNGGPVLDHVHLVTVSFADTADDSVISGFGDWVVTSGWWSTVGADYGVGPGTHEHVRLSDATPTTLTNAEIAAYVDSLVESGTLPSAPESAYMLFTSTAVTVTDAADADGWHDRSPAGHVYAVVTAGCATTPPGLVAQAYEMIASHELIELATDPDPPSGYNFGFGQGEVADLCNEPVVEDGYTVATIWSNSEAAKGARPCVPSTEAPGIGVDVVKALQISAQSGSTARLKLTGWSTERVGDFRLDPIFSGSNMGAFQASFGNETDLINDGRSVELTVTNMSAPAGTSAVLAISSLAPNGVSPVRGLVGARGVQWVTVTVTH